MRISVRYTWIGTWFSIHKPSVFYLEVESCATIDDLKTKIRAQEGSDHEECRQRWTFEGRHLAGGRTLAECKVREGSVLDLAVDRWGDLMEIFVLTQAGLRITRMVVSTDTVAYVKSELQDELEAMDPRVDQQQQQRLFFYGKELQDDRTLEEYGIGEGFCLHVVLQSLGGSAPLMGATDGEGEAALAQELLSRHSRPGEMDTGSVLVTKPTSWTIIEDEEYLRLWEIGHRLQKLMDCCKPGTTYDADKFIDFSILIQYFDPDWKTRMLKRMIKRMIFSMEQRRRRGGNVYVGKSKTFSSESLDFRDNYISIVLFDGSYVWIKSRDPAHCKGVLPRRRIDRLGRVYFKYEPRFKPPREKTPSGETLKFNYLSLGEYDTPEQAAEVWKMLAYYYGKHDGRLELADGTHFCVPPMLQALSGTEKRNWVKAKVKEVREEFRKELEASKNRLVIPEDLVNLDELMATFDEAQLDDQQTSSFQDRSADVAYQMIELPNTVASGFEFNTNWGISDEQLNPQVAELLQVNRQLSEQLQQRRDNEQRLLQENEELKRVVEQHRDNEQRLLQEKEEWKRVLLPVVETLKGAWAPQ